MSLFVNTFFEERLQDLFNLAARVEKAFGAAGIEYRVVGGLAAYLYVEEAEADAGRLTKDIDILVRREDLPKIAVAVEPFGLEYRHAAGVDMLVQKGAPSARRAVHIDIRGRCSPLRPDAPRNPGCSASGSGEDEAHQLSDQGRDAPQGSGRTEAHHARYRIRTYAAPP